MVDIFNDSNKVQLNTVKFKAIGDKVQGTLIGKRMVKNVLKNNEDQIVYDIKLEDGRVASVFGKPGIDFQMEHIKLGQIVGFEFTKILPPKNPAFKPTHVIQVYADAKVVDEQWLKEQEEAQMAAEVSTSFNHPATPSFMDSEKPPKGAVPVQPLPAQPTVTGGTPAAASDVPFESAAPSKETQIKDWAKAKIPGVTDANFMNVVMEKTGVPYISINYDKILELLKAM